MIINLIFITALIVSGMSRQYSVKEIFYTLQGEGVQAGTPAVFLRFSGCNFWNGKEEDRERSVCTFCDTDFTGTDGAGGGVFTSAWQLADAVLEAWPKDNSSNRMVVCTGGEPLLQLDEPLISALHEKEFRISIETNGSIRVPEGIDWVAVSPKSLDKLVQTSGDELKLVYPNEIDPREVIHLDFEYFLLSPKWVNSPDETKIHINQVIEYCKHNPEWRLSIQQHKIWGIA
jgi:7-carboxy-7-deazaguanine synthase